MTRFLLKFDFGYSYPTAAICSGIIQCIVMSNYNQVKYGKDYEVTLILSLMEAMSAGETFRR